MIAPWPGMSRGTDWTVPRVPGLVRVTVAPAKSSGVDLLGVDLAHQVLVGEHEGPEVEGVGVAARTGTSSVRVPSDLLHVDGEPEPDVGVADHPGRALAVGVGDEAWR